jgi:2-polyprenyl-3-methyl-5-hydroxy-6-metoxy-1,4-benzoquinol methylase
VRLKFPTVTLPDPIIAEEQKVCPLCGATESSLFDRRDFRGQPVINWLCTRCGCVFQYPHLTEKSLAAFYEQEYRQLYQGSAGPSPKDLGVQEARAMALQDFVQKHGARFSRHLDIGSSAGLLLMQFHTAFGSQGVGIEPGEAYRKYAQENGIATYAALEEIDLTGESRFDLISLAHVVEHLPDPIGILQNLRQKYLTATGWLLIEVPNLYAHDCFEIAHLVSFSEHTLRQTLQRAGFTVKALEKHGRPRSVRIPLYLTALAQPGQAAENNPGAPGEKEVGVRRQRKIGLIRRLLIERLMPRQAWKPVGK